MTTRTRKEMLTQFRDSVAYRMITFEANVEWFSTLNRNAPANSQEKVDAIRNLAQNEQNLALDRKFLKVIDEMIRKEK